MEEDTLVKYIAQSLSGFTGIIIELNFKEYLK